MDEIQFGRFQDAIQWVVDEGKTSGLHQQGFWGLGKVSGDILDPVGFDNVDEYYIDDVNAYVPITCNSGMCLAGNGVIAAGDSFVVGFDSLSAALATKENMSADLCIDRDGVIHEIDDRAMALFGLDEDEAELMFSGSNTADLIVMEGRQIAKAHGYTLTLV